METAEPNFAFAGTIPALYDQFLGPVIFAPYADDRARRIAARVKSGRLLEIACGTGMLTRRLEEVLPKSVAIVATDLNEAMVALARTKVASSDRIEWRTADAAVLPDALAGLDAVACQFGYMFVPDKAAAFRASRRVPRTGGALTFSVWCRIDENPYARIAHEVIGGFFGARPPDFYRIPFSFHDADAIRALLAASRFGNVSIERLTLKATAPSVHDFARGLVEDNPVIHAIREAKLSVPTIIDAVAVALAAEGGDHPFAVAMNALVVAAEAV